MHILCMCVLLCVHCCEFNKCLSVSASQGTSRPLHSQICSGYSVSAAVWKMLPIVSRKCMYVGTYPCIYTLCVYTWTYIIMCMCVHCTVPVLLHICSSHAFHADVNLNKYTVGSRIERSISDPLQYRQCS